MRTYGFLASGILALSLLSSAALAAPTYTWNTVGNSPTDGMDGNQRTFSAVEDAGMILKVRGYSTWNNDGTGNFRDAFVGAYSGGLGITNPSSSNEDDSPNHGVDNNGKDDFLLFEFASSDFKATGFKIGWREYNNTDIQVWVGGTNAGAGLDLSSDCGGACDKNDLDDLGFTLLPTFFDVDPGESPSINTSIAGRYLLITGRAGYADDYFKLKVISALQEVTVPEPSSLALLAGSLLGLGGLARRKRRA